MLHALLAVWYVQIEMYSVLTHPQCDTYRNVNGPKDDSEEEVEGEAYHGEPVWAVGNWNCDQEGLWVE